MKLDLCSSIYAQSFYAMLPTFNCCNVHEWDAFTQVSTDVLSQVCKSPALYSTAEACYLFCICRLSLSVKSTLLDRHASGDVSGSCTYWNGILHLKILSFRRAVARGVDSSSKEVYCGTQEVYLFQDSAHEQSVWIQYLKS